MTAAAPLLDARVITGGEAVAEAMRQIDPDVVPVYPITPQTPMIQGFARFAAEGRAHGEIVNVESEHSAMSAAIGSALAGARTITATSSQGLALMAEVLYIAAAMRAPIVMGVGNRALSGPRLCAVTCSRILRIIFASTAPWPWGWMLRSQSP